MTDRQSFDRNRQSCFRDREVIADLRLKLRSQGDVFSNWDQIVIAISMCDKDRNRDRDLNFGDQAYREIRKMWYNSGKNPKFWFSLPEKRAFQLVVFKSGQKMARREVYVVIC